MVSLWDLSHKVRDEEPSLVILPFFSASIQAFLSYVLNSDQLEVFSPTLSSVGNGSPLLKEENP